MTTPTNGSYGIKTQLSLASLMFFGPFIRHFLGENEGFELSESDKLFVKGYMLLGTVNLALALICLTFGILSTFFSYQWISILFVVFSCALLLLLIAGSIGVFADISLTKIKNETSPEEDTQIIAINQNSIREYLPFVNIYLWYHLHDFEGKHPILKESLIMWTLFATLCLTGNIWIISICMILIIIRIVTLMVIGDGFPQRWREGIDSLFHKNIEEIWGWCTGRFLRSIGKLFRRSSLLSTKRQEQQLSYSYLYDLKKYGTIQWQYLLFLLGGGYLLSLTPTWDSFGFIVAGTCLLLGRYVMMAIVWGHLPPLPIINDIFRAIGSLFEKKQPISK
ncbi:MAG: hypothetical protein WCO66_01475 [Candidatus Absconditabacteria bacterium]